jgi:hypothetical protein
MKATMFMICLVIGVGAPVFSLDDQGPSAAESVSAAECVDKANPSAEKPEYPAGAFTFDFLASVTWPSVIDITDRISTDRFAFGFGVGYHLNFIDKILAPGLYVDFGIGGPIIIYENSSSENAVAYDSYGSIGLRAYNLFTVSQFGLKPFFGFSFIGNAEIKQNNEIIHERFGLWSWIAGIIFTYKHFGFEYAFCVPDFNNIIPFPYKNYHRISLLFHAL